MARDSDDLSFLTYLVIGMAAGAAFMYFMDPVQGRRRRALFRDKAYSASVQTKKAVDARAHDLSNRAQGLRMKASRMLH
ncbi:MAG: YtxH domain-containing protein [Burkholderiaceae bacterium]